jgi:hypothetical protein
VDNATCNEECSSLRAKLRKQDIQHSRGAKVGRWNNCISNVMFLDIYLNRQLQVNAHKKAKETLEQQVKDIKKENIENGTWQLIELAFF